MIFRSIASSGLLLTLFFFSQAPANAQQSLLGVAEVLAMPVTPPEAVISYGPDSVQFGELRLPPDGEGPFPVVVILHGGCWVAAIADLHLMDPMASRLAEAGYATWNLEYRRVGSVGGGWPNTFLDVAAGINHLRTLARQYPLDLSKVVVAGHSAGGHLALWLGAREKIASTSDVYDPDPLPLTGIISLAGIVDPESYLVREGRGCGSSVDELLGGLPEDLPDRYHDASPLRLASGSTPQILITGEEDRIVPISHVSQYAVPAAGEDHPVESVVIPAAGHFELIAPGSIAWPAIMNALGKLIN